MLASRIDPPLALARLRARGQLAELRAAELRFTAGEAAALLRQDGRAGRPCPTRRWRRWRRGPRGGRRGCSWPRLSLRGQDDVAGFVAAFTGSHRYVLDYLAEEVLERQDEQVRTFLLETSVLERLSGPLCDAVTGSTGSQALLEQVERAGLFLVPLDEVRGWWRYHHLFADLLRARLEQQPGRAAQLHCNAATWYAEHGLADDAIRHAAAAGEMTWAARLIEQHFDELFYLRGEGATVQRWLSALPDDLVQVAPPAVAGAGPAGRGHQRPGGGGGTTARRGRARIRKRRRGAVRAHCRPGWQPAGEHRRRDRAACEAISLRSAGTPRARPRSRRRLWPSSARASRC